MWMKNSLLVVALAGLLSGCATMEETIPGLGGGVGEEPPGDNYKKVSEVTRLPAFVPGMGTLYARPGEMPVGPYLAYDEEGELVSTIYMIPLEQMRNNRDFNNLGVAEMETTQVDVTYNPGHPGLDRPHYHVVLWHVAPEEAELRM